MFCHIIKLVSWEPACEQLQDDKGQLLVSQLANMLASAMLY